MSKSGKGRYYTIKKRDGSALEKGKKFQFLKYKTLIFITIPLWGLVYFDHDWNLHVGEKQLELLAPPGTDGPWTDTFKRLQIFQDLHGSNQSLVSKE